MSSLANLAGESRLMNTFRDRNRELRELRRKEYQKLSPFLSLGAAASFLGVDRDTVFVLTEKGVFEPIYVERKMMLRRNQVIAWLNERSKQ